MNGLQEQATPLFWGDKRYHTWNFHLREKFGEKVLRLCLMQGSLVRIAMGWCLLVDARFVVQGGPVILLAGVGMI